LKKGGEIGKIGSNTHDKINNETFISEQKRM
jgi:hypothetical protein